MPIASFSTPPILLQRSYIQARAMSPLLQHRRALFCGSYASKRHLTASTCVSVGRPVAPSNPDLKRYRKKPLPTQRSLLPHCTTYRLVQTHPTATSWYDVDLDNTSSPRLGVTTVSDQFSFLANSFPAGRSIAKTALPTNSRLFRAASSARLFSCPPSSSSHLRQFSTSPTTMAAVRLDGTALAKSIREALHSEIAEKQKANPLFQPSLKIIQGMNLFSLPP